MKGGNDVQITMKAARVNKGYTQQEAANLLNTTKDVVSNWERGISFPDVIMLKKIEQVYGVTYQDLLFLHPNNA